MWCEPGVYTTKFENSEMKIEGEINNFLEEDLDVDDGSRERKGICGQVSPDSNNTS